MPTSATGDAVPRIAIYLHTARVDGDRAWSVYGQRFAIHHYLRSLGDDFRIVREYSDVAPSGGRRPGWHDLVTTAMAGTFDTLVVFHPSRISRDRLVLDHYMRHLGRLGVAVLAATEPDAVGPPSVQTVVAAIRSRIAAPASGRTAR